jgi:hypothetical protein
VSSISFSLREAVIDIEFSASSVTLSMIGVVEEEFGASTSDVEFSPKAEAITSGVVLT